MDPTYVRSTALSSYREIIEPVRSDYFVPQSIFFRPLTAHFAVVPLASLRLCTGRPIFFKMNGVNGVAAPPGLWQEARNPEGRVYYYNTQTKATQWTKPQELMAPAEVYGFLTYENSANNHSVRLQTSHGRSTLRQAAENTGTTRKLNRAPGRCQRSTRARYLKLLHSRRSQLLRKFHLTQDIKCFC